MKRQAVDHILPEEISAVDVASVDVASVDVASVEAKRRFTQQSKTLRRSAMLSAISVLVIGVLSTGTQAQTDKSLAAQHLGPVTIDEYSRLLWRPDDNYFRSTGPVRITLQDAVTGDKTVLVADDAEGSPSGDIVVHGRIRLERAEGLLTGRAFTYRASDRTGTVLDARAELANLLVSGQKIELMPDRSAKATGASFTTCIKLKPDYHITAREITVSPDNTVRAKNIGFYVKGTKIISLPSFRKSFKRTVTNPIPLPSYSKEDFLQFRFSDAIIDTPRTALTYNIRLSTRRTPDGEVRYEHDLARPEPSAAPPETRLVASRLPLRSALEAPDALTSLDANSLDPRRTVLYGQFTSNGPVYNRNRSDLQVSRLPEFGVSLRNVFGARVATDEADRRTVLGATAGNPSSWVINAEAGVGYFRERPTRAERLRLGGRIDAASPHTHIQGPVYARFGATAWGNLYGAGTSYSILAPELELSFRLRANTFVSAALRYMEDFGQTPFFFDRRDIEQEMRLRYGFLGANWAYDLEVKYDLERVRAYDTFVAIRRRFDCMEVGVGYRTRDQGLNLILNLLPGSIRK